MKIIINRCYGCWELSKEAIEEYKKRSGNTYYEIDGCSPRIRKDPVLIEVIEDFIKEDREVSGEDSRLEIVDIPNEYDYWIDDYDGRETVYLRIRENHLRHLIHQGVEDDIVRYVMNAG